MCRRVIGVWLIMAFLLCDKASATQYAFRIDFTDKNNTPYNLSTPIFFLSPRAIARRVTQGIPVDSTDIPVNYNYLDSVVTLTGGVLHESSRWLNLCVILLTDSSLIHNLDGKPFIKSKKLVYFGGDLHFKQAGNDPQPGHKITSDGTYYGVTWNQTTMVNGNYLHDLGFKGNGKLIAVFDAGFIATDTHPGFDSMWNAGRVMDQHNFVFNSSSVFGNDDHGTKVLSTMAGYVPGDFVGTAPLASYAFYVTEHNPTEQPIELINMLCAAERADSIGADIITSSLGYDFFDDPADNFVFATDLDGKSTVAAKAANMATKKGMLFIASAGNEGGGPWNMVLTPGDADSALTIGSVELTGSPWPTSGYGPNAAGQVKPDVCALGHVASIFGTPTGYTAQDGTSFATPQIAGWAACLWEANPTASPFQLRQAIIRCASSYATPGNHIGYGIPNFHCTEQVLNITNPPSPFTDANWVIVAPNPVSDELSISVSPTSDGLVEFKLVDIAGKSVSSFRQNLRKGYNSPIVFSAQGLPAGLYILKAVSATQQQVVKFSKL